MGPLFTRYFQLLAGRGSAAEYGVIATPSLPTDEAHEPAVGAEITLECLCPAS